RYPVTANAFGYQIGQVAITLPQPAPRRNTVGYIGKFIGKLLCKVFEDSLLHQAAVQLRHSVYFLGAYNTQIPHPNPRIHLVADNTHTILFPAIYFNSIQKPAVDLPDNLRLTRQ